MPKIKADSVKEHREKQLQNLLRITKEIIRDSGCQALSFSEIADKAGLARPSLYEYFKNKSDILSALIDIEFPIWIEQVEKAMAKESSPELQVKAFFQAQLKMHKKDLHSIAFSLMHGELNPEIKNKVNEHHFRLFALLNEPLEKLGFANSEDVTTLVSGVLSSILLLVESKKSSPRRLANFASDFVLGGLDRIIGKHKLT